MKYIKQIPLPVGGVILGLISLAKLMQSYNEYIISDLFLVMGLLFLSGVLLKLICYRDIVKKEIQNPIVASVLPTYTMAILIGTSMFFSYEWAKFIWYGACIVHIGLMGYFTKVFIIDRGLSMNHIFPSWFITFIGLAMMPLTAGGMMPRLMTYVFFVALCCYVLLMPVVLYRVFVQKNLPTPTLPLIGILTAPSSLILMAFMNHFPDGSTLIIWILLVVAQLFFIVVLSQLPKLLALPFYPSYAGLTFPFVITATACQTAFTKLHVHNGFTQLIGNVEMYIAIMMVMYVVFRYTMFLMTKSASEPTTVPNRS